MFCKRLRRRFLGLGCSIVLALLAAPADSTASTITFSETVASGPGFNGQTNPFLLSLDGEYRVEAFWLSTSGHFHIFNFGGTNGLAENNHNNSGGLANQVQGIRITRLDGDPFSLLSMDLFGQAAIGQITNSTTGAGTFSLYNGSGTAIQPGSIAFGSAFSDLTYIDLVDPGRAGGTSFGNVWDNIELAQAPEPASTLLFGFGLLALARASRRRKVSA